MNIVLFLQNPIYHICKSFSHRLRPYSRADLRQQGKKSYFILNHYNDVIMSAMASQITSLTIFYSTVYWERRSNKTSKLRVTGLCEGHLRFISIFISDPYRSFWYYWMEWIRHPSRPSTTPQSSYNSCVSTYISQWENVYTEYLLTRRLRNLEAVTFSLKYLYHFVI